MSSDAPNATPEARDGLLSMNGSAAPHIDTAFLEAIFDTIDLAVAAFDADWRYIYLNDRAEHVLGRTRRAMLGQVFWDDAEAVEPAYAEALRRAMSQRERVITERYSSYSGAWYEVLALPLAPCGLVLTYRDITQRKAAETERDRLLAQTHAARQAAEARAAELDAVFDALTDGAAVYDASGRMLRLNRTLREVMGLDAGAAPLGDTIRERLPRFLPRDEHGRPFTSERFPVTRLLRGEVLDEQHPAEMIARRADGQDRSLNVTGSPLRDSAGHITGAVAIVRDITEQRDLMRELAASEARFRAIFERAAVGLARVGLDGQWIEVNQELCRIVGYPRDELLALTFQDITYPPDLESDLALLRDLSQGRIPSYALEKRYVRKDGSLIWILLTVSLVRDEAGTPLYYISAVEDVEARKRLEAEREALTAAEHTARMAAETSEARLATLVATLPQLILVLTPDSQHITFANARWQEYTGVDPTTAISSQVVARRVYPDDVAAFTAARERAVAAEEPTTMEARFLGADGIYRWFIAHLRPIRGADHVITGWFFSATDIDDLKQTQERLEALTATLEVRVAERTAALEEANRDLDAFAHTAAHDLRAPLRGMEGFAQALIEDYGATLDPLASRYAERIAAAARTMDALIQDLLAYAQLGRADIRPGPVSLAQMITRAREQLAEVIARTGAKITVEEPLPDVWANSVMLQQALLNLLSNALLYVAPDATPEVHISAARREGAGRPWVRLTVSDRGIGIAPEHVERIFQPFERLHGAEAYPGTGIGLATVRRGIERMGGHVGVESEPGLGSRFWIELPEA